MNAPQGSHGRAGETDASQILLNYHVVHNVVDDEAEAKRKAGNRHLDTYNLTKS